MKKPNVHYECKLLSNGLNLERIIFVFSNQKGNVGVFKDRTFKMRLQFSFIWNIL